jgi:hypothetical protein
MKRIVGFMLILGLIAGSLAAPAMAKKKKKPRKPAITQVDQKFFLRRDDCAADDDNTHLSIVDGPDAGCWLSDAGVLYDVIGQVFTAAGEDADLSEPYPATDGVPFVLDASKPITGEIYLYGGDCLQDPACSPVGISAGNAVFEVRVFATIDGEEKELGKFTDTFTTTPGSDHTSTINIPVDSALNGKQVTDFRITAYHGGQAYGPGGISYDDPASFITVPTLVTK